MKYVLQNNYTPRRYKCEIKRRNNDGRGRLKKSILLSLRGETTKQSGYYKLFPDRFTPLPPTQFCNPLRKEKLITCNGKSRRDGNFINRRSRPTEKIMRGQKSRRDGTYLDFAPATVRLLRIFKRRGCLKSPISSLRTK
jgi:hypothetical protein